jgi:hypothetical protein
MDRRSFLKRSVAASVLVALSIDINECAATWQPVKGETGQNKLAPGLPSGRMVLGGNLFNAYARGRDSLYAAEVRVKRTRYFLWKGAY